MESSGLLSIEREQSWIKLTLSPKFGFLPSIDPFKAAIEQNLAGEENQVVLDMSRVEQLNSVALGALMWLYRRIVQRNEAKVVCVNATDGVKEILRYSRLDRLIPVMEEDELMDYFDRLKIAREEGK